MRHTPLTILLLLCSLACTSGDNGKVRPLGESAAAPVPDTVPSAPPPQVAPAVKKLSRPAQRAWDTAAPESFDLEEVNRRRAEPGPEKPYIPLTKSDTLKMLAEMKPDEYGAYGYLKPSEYPGLPLEIAGWLEERDFVIPQIVPPMDRFIKEEWKFQNAVKGEFIRSGQTDWAVYCTNGQEAEIFLFQNASADSVVRVKKFLNGYDQLACCWYWLHRIAPDVLAKYHRLREGQKIRQYPIIRHDGIAVGSADYHHFDIYFDMGKMYLYESADDE